MSKLFIMFERAEIQIIRRRIKEPRRHIQVVMGPRQVGKTTMMRQLFATLDIPGIFESADAVPVSNFNWLSQIWEKARLQIKTQSLPELLLVIDEIQKISNWSELVKKLWDEDTFHQVPLKVILLGSSRLLLQKGLTESLAGRFETIHLTHWTFSEMEQAFGWDANTYAWFGGYPGSADLISNEDRWKKYICDSLIETSISRDILMLTRIDKPALLKQLFELGVHYSGQILSYNKILGQLQDAGNSTTLSHYLSLLDTAGLLCGLSKFAFTDLRKRASSPKFQVYNNALKSALNRDTVDTISSDFSLWGRMVESVVGTHLVNQSIKHNYTVHYWREGNYEVDFILESKGKVVAIEVKSNQSKNKIGLDAFQQKFSPQKALVIDNRGFSWQQLLKTNPLDLF